MSKGVSPDNATKNLEQLIEHKVNKQDFDSQMSQKASKDESEMMLRQIEVIHNQLKQLVQVLAQKFKVQLEPTKGESE